MIVDGHGCHTALHFGVKAEENQDKVPTLYWLPKLHKKTGLSPQVKYFTDRSKAVLLLWIF